MKAKRIISLLLALFLMTAVLCGCGDGKAEDNTPTAPEDSSATEQTNELVVGIAQDLDTSLDPHKMTAAGTREVLFNVFEGLVKPTTDGNLVPAVAKSYTVSENADTFTFTLRRGVKFHDGRTVTVGDIVYSISRVAGLETGTPLISAFSAVKSVYATDDDTVVIETNEPYLEFVSFLTAAIIPEGSDPADGLIGTGPFKYVSRSAQENIVIEKFDEYWGEGAKLDKVTFKVIENTDALIMSLKSGAIYLCAHLTPVQTSDLGDDFKVLQGNMNLVSAMYLNHAYEPLSDIRVRRALCYAIDRQMMLDFVSEGQGSIIGSSMYPGLGKYYEDLADTYAYDPAKAKELLKEAGYENGFDLEIVAPSNYQIYVDCAQVIVEQLKAVGINATISKVEWTQWLEQVYQGRNYQATIVGFDSSSAMTAQSMLARFVSTSSKNVCNYVSEDYDTIFNQAITATDEQAQIMYYKMLQTILNEDAANVYLQDPCDNVAMKKNIEGYKFYPIYVLDLSSVYFAD